MSEDSGKRGLRAFVDWVENGPDWRMRPVCMKAGPAGMAGRPAGMERQTPCMLRSRL